MLWEFWFLKKNKNKNENRTVLSFQSQVWVLWSSRGEILPAAESFCDCVVIWILGTFHKVYKCYGASKGRVGGLLISFLSSHTQKKKQQKEEIRYLDGKDQTCPKELNTPNQQEAAWWLCHPFPLHPFFSPTYCKGVERLENGGEGWKKKETTK